MRALLTAILLPALIGCSGNQLLYRNADWLIEQWADRLLDLTTEQKADWRNHLDPALTRHREVEVPRLAGFFQDVEQHARHELPEPVVECLVAQLDGLVRSHARLAVEIAVPLLTDLTAEQVAGLAENLEERNGEYREEYLQGDIEQRTAERAHRVLERIELWSGPLNADQRSMVEQASREMPDLAGSWLEYRRERQAQLLRLLQSGAGAEALHRFLDGWWVERADRPLSLVDATDAVQRSTVTLLSRLDGTLSRAQRRELVARIARVRTDLEVLSGNAPVPEPLCSQTADLARQ